MFDHVRQQVRAQFDKIVTGTLFRTDPDRDKIWQLYLSNIPELERQSCNCNCCQAFLRQYGGIVGIDAATGKRVTLWDFVSVDPDYRESVKAVHDYVVGLPIIGPFVNSFARLGTEKNPDKVRNIIWTHYFLDLPRQFVKREPEIGPFVGTAVANKEVLERALVELTDDAVNTVLELVAQGSLYRGNEFEPTVKAFRDLKKRYNELQPNPEIRSNWCWVESSGTHAAVARIRNSAIGTLLVDLSEGRDLDGAVTAYERVTAPSTYRRPTSLVTPRMIDTAKKRLEELGLVCALQRRLLSETDLNVNNTLFVHRPIKTGGDVFDQLKQETVINPKSLTKVEEISIEDFISGVLPTAKSIRVLLDNPHFGNFASLVGPVDPAGPTLFKWGNSFSWSYSGAVTDSIKERVKAAGGKVDGVVRVSLSWHNYDDLDLHVIEPKGFEIYYGDRRGQSGGVLDVDQNAGGGHTRTPVENICWAQNPTQEGVYRVVIVNFAPRESRDVGFEVELEFDGQVYNFESSLNGHPGQKFPVLEFSYTRAGGVVVRGNATTGIARYNSKEKWGLKTGLFHRVRAITLSPNHWTGAAGNKHYFFFLEGCKSDEATRGFYNEFLKPELDQDRKVFEVLGSKVEVEPTDKELSGLGFSDTIRNEMICEVEGNFKRLLKVKF